MEPTGYFIYLSITSAQSLGPASISLPAYLSHSFIAKLRKEKPPFLYSDPSQIFFHFFILLRTKGKGGRTISGLFSLTSVFCPPGMEEPEARWDKISSSLLNILFIPSFSLHSVLSTPFSHSRRYQRSTGRRQCIFLLILLIVGTILILIFKPRHRGGGKDVTPPSPPPEVSALAEMAREVRRGRWERDGDVRW